MSNQADVPSEHEKYQECPNMKTLIWKKHGCRWLSYEYIPCGNCSRAWARAWSKLEMRLSAHSWIARYTWMSMVRQHASKIQPIPDFQKRILIYRVSNLTRFISLCHDMLSHECLVYQDGKWYSASVIQQMLSLQYFTEYARARTISLIAALVDPVCSVELHLAWEHGTQLDQ